MLADPLLIPASFGSHNLRLNYKNALDLKKKSSFTSEMNDVKWCKHGDLHVVPWTDIQVVNQCRECL